MKNLALLFTCLLLFSCVKDKPVVSAPQEVNLGADPKVYVINEGIFQSGNASVSLFDPSTGQVVVDYYGAQNATVLGDVAQSMNYIAGKYYIVVNNSGKIEVCDRHFQKAATVTGMASPRYLLPVSNQKAYVSDFKANGIYIVDLNINSTTGFISCSGWTEKMALVFGKVYVTNMKSNYLYVVNTTNDQVTDSIAVGISCGSVVLDKNDRLWTLSAGDGTHAGKLSRINPTNGSVETSLDFPAGASPWNLCINGAGDTLYFLNNDVYRMPVVADQLPASPFIARGTRNYYGLGIDPNNKTVYVSDALDYTQRSVIYVYDAKGTLRTLFNAGINANGFYFE